MKTQSQTVSIENLKRQHRRYERTLAGVIAGTFRGQSLRLATELRNFDTITVATIDQVFRVDNEHKRFMAAIRGPLSIVVGESAYREWQSLRLQKAGEPLTSKGWGADLVSGLWDKLPRKFLQYIRAALDELEVQDYWRAIQEATRTRLSSIVRAGLQDGETTRDIAKSLQRWLGGAESKSRTLAIARTETTGAMNSGHFATHKGLAADGVLTARVWRSIIDKTTRETHVKADGQTVKGMANFVIGGSEARYPGDVLLPANERVRCRCVVTGRVD